MALLRNTLEKTGHVRHRKDDYEHQGKGLHAYFWFISYQTTVQFEQCSYWLYRLFFLLITLSKIIILYSKWQKQPM